MKYAALSGNVLTVHSSVRDAVASIRRVAPSRPIMVETTTSPSFQVNAVATPAQARIAAKLPELSRSDVMSMSVEEAAAEVARYTPRKVTKGKRLDEEALAARLGPNALADWLLSQNAKLSKEIAGYEARSFGLSMLPYNMLWLLGRSDNPFGSQLDPVRRAWVASKAPRGLRASNTLCLGSNEQCRTACLVFSGSNTKDVHNVMAKAGKTAMLQNHPAAFVRLLHEACKRFIVTARRGGKARVPFVPFVRLNVFSDVPWELVIKNEWLQRELGGRDGIRFYDYTKVPGRKTRHTDITFSYSGTNMESCVSEVRAGHRIAMVFLGHRKQGNKWVPWLKRSKKTGTLAPLPTRVLGLGPKPLPVIDGDVSDFRPRDPKHCVVGLRWKIPAKQAVKRDDMSFVTPVKELGDVLVAATTPRYMPIEQTGLDG